MFTNGEEVDDDVEHEDDQGDDGEVDGAVVAHPHCAASHMFEFRLGMHGQTMPMLAECHNLTQNLFHYHMGHLLGQDRLTTTSAGLTWPLLSN